jgi:Rieske Fe-S protein
VSWPVQIWEEHRREEEWLAQTQICQTLGCSNLAEENMWRCRACHDEEYLTDLRTSWLDPEPAAVDPENRS